MTRIEMHVIPHPERVYARAEKFVAPLTRVDSETVITPLHIGRMVVLDRANKTSYLLPRSFPPEDALGITIMKGHDLLQSLAPLRCNQFGITTNYTGN